ncbi:MAG: LCP family protein, partial [Solobacterium sp.]|nr:LCP family protein [Solobacterium sp.]
MSKQETRRQKKHIRASLYWFVSLLAAVLFLIVFYFMPMLPNKWAFVAGTILLFLLIITGYFSFRKGKSKKLAIKIINLLITAALLVGSIILPNIKTRVSEVIETNTPKENVINMNLYVMSDKYIDENPSLHIQYPSQKSDSLEDLQQYKDSTFITTLTIDSDYQLEALDLLRESIGREDIELYDAQSLQEAGEKLYAGEGVMLMSEVYASMLPDMEGFEDFEEDTRILYTIEVPEVVQEIKRTDVALTTQPFSVFFGGNDQEGELKLSGRTDVDMVVTVNPKTHQIAICSMPRDSYIPNPAYGNRPDKLTHLGVTGLDNTLRGLGNVLNVDIDNYILINFTTYKQIIDAIGGVDVNNPYAFDYTWDDYSYPEGMIHLDGQAALYYVRERYNLPNGDFDRNMHQQIVMRAIIEKVASPTVITRFNSILNALEGTFLTNLSDTSIYSFCQMQLEEGIEWNIVNYRSLGDVGNAICAAAPGQALSVVYPYKNQVDFMAQVINDVIEGKIVEQQEMPAGRGYLVQPVLPVETPEATATPKPTP